MKTRLFDYHLPKKLIAQKSVHPRDHSRLMVLDHTKKMIVHRRFFEIGDFLRRDDLLVVNDTKVFKARLLGEIKRANGQKKTVELFLLQQSTPSQYIVLPLQGGEEKIRFSPPSVEGGEQEGVIWYCLGKPGKWLMPGVEILFDRVKARVIEKHEHGELIVEFFGVSDVVRWANRVGHIPIPPYVAREPKNFKVYQTVYARRTGSVAAPTAGFHFTPRLMRSLKKKGIMFASVTLHVGLGTFRPMTADTLEEHIMHEEYAEIPARTMRLIKETKERGGRVIAVGTTTVRALEGLLIEGSLRGAKRRSNPVNTSPSLFHGIATLPLGARDDTRRGMVNLFIRPGYRFKIIDGLITNFHLPRSTLLVLVSAFAGRRFVLKAYRTAVAKKYRFYSFGDAQFIH